MPINAIITGSTGMVGEGVLHECLRHSEVESILVINRRSCGVEHPKLKEIIHDDFLNFDPIQDQLRGYNAAFLCMGTTSFGLDEEKYSRITYDMTLALAKSLAELNPDMTLTYVSGKGTPSHESGRIMWTRVKAKTENALLALPVKQAYMFRPGGMQAVPGAKNLKTSYKILNLFMPILLILLPGSVHTLRALALSMIRVARTGYDKQAIEVEDIKKLEKLELREGKKDELNELDD